ncbi:hypothetical protein A2Y99_02805 [Candidatus Gottesmanbacteria bacterium RBG_13_37_7]|uniref:Amine oxidase domain-containing protein n=1 Tax=Candidatus Gottesmanbacteria bacterium RBG_13_37_7 TaxID=1798369 RepID=A0A1F5YI28_9BACT|nr:MAG: hypothetical protein A2Y99_02805 [Candidatus Gottesmanbacteria bacterium RBG_13_37_7]
MKIAVIGAGFTGLTASYELVRNHHVTVFEKEDDIGGLAGVYQLPHWQWPVEKHYHHWFTNDKYALDLIRNLGLAKKLIFPRVETSILMENNILPFDSPGNVLTFPYLPFPDRIRTGAATLLLKLIPSSLSLNFEKYKACDLLPKFFGEKTYLAIWEPLLRGKFNGYYQKVNMAWFWARIKKRTPRLGYLEGGYGLLLEKMVDVIRDLGGKVLLKSQFSPADVSRFDKVIITSPSSVLSDIFPSLPCKYSSRLEKIPHLHALTFHLITKKKFLEKTYWLNINDRQYPFIAVVQHTNLVSEKHYGGNHVTYIANYLPPAHPFLKLSKTNLYKHYLPYLRKINQNFDFKSLIIRTELFDSAYAQPVFGINYSAFKPDFQTPIKNVYLANMDMVYPWDRGTNYAIRLGLNIARFVLKN